MGVEFIRFFYTRNMAKYYKTKVIGGLKVTKDGSPFTDKGGKIMVFKSGADADKAIEADKKPKKKATSKKTES